MFIRQDELTVETTAGTDIIDLTGQVTDFLASSGAADGLLTVFVPGSTGAVTTIEYEPGVLEDLAEAVERLTPRGIPYAHDAAWGDGNGYSHVRAALLGPGLSIPFAAGRLILGAWQQVVLLDFDNRPRRRRVVLQILAGGES
jgi:secondary thiamine-phosphate synthase enzyme